MGLHILHILNNVLSDKKKEKDNGRHNVVVLGCVLKNAIKIRQKVGASYAECLAVSIPSQARGPVLGKLCELVNDMNTINNSKQTLCGSKQKCSSVLVPSVNSRRTAA